VCCPAGHVIVETLHEVTWALPAAPRPDVSQVWAAELSRKQSQLV
jgi:hypothetical protein